MTVTDITPAARARGALAMRLYRQAAQTLSCRHGRYDAQNAPVGWQAKQRAGLRALQAQLGWAQQQVEEQASRDESMTASEASWVQVESPAREIAAAASIASPAPAASPERRSKPPTPEPVALDGARAALAPCSPAVAPPPPRPETPTTEARGAARSHLPAGDEGFSAASAARAASEALAELRQAPAVDMRPPLCVIVEGPPLPPTQHVVSVPAGVAPGGSFVATVGDVLMTVPVPLGMPPGAVQLLVEPPELSEPGLWVVPVPTDAVGALPPAAEG
jgi:hypothetical protein